MSKYNTYKRFTLHNDFLEFDKLDEAQKKLEEIRDAYDHEQLSHFELQRPHFKIKKLNKNEAVAYPEAENDFYAIFIKRNFVQI